MYIRIQKVQQITE